MLDLILLRARQRNSHNEAFAAELRRVSGCEVRFLLDERDAGAPSTEPDVVSLNQDSYRSLGLYTPPDVAWRCGDYGAYLAWKQDPGRRYYWVIEDDVRIAGDAAQFFELCETTSADFLTAHLRKTLRGNFWWPHTMSRNAQAYACLFCAVRLSNRAVEVSYKKRQEHSSQLLRRALWPNDEGLVATTVGAHGYLVQDYNEIRSGLWSPDSCSVTGEPRTAVASSGPPHLVHPVRFAKRTAEHVKQTSWEDVASLRYRIKQRVVRGINAHRSW